MKEIIVLSSKNYESETKRYGDCLIINNGYDVAVYDCGSVEHAQKVEEYLAENFIDKVKVIISHDDSDHFDGIPYLIEKGLVSEVYSILLLKYKDEILKRIDDKRKTEDSIVEQIKEIYSNIASLSGKVKLVDAEVDLEIIDSVKIVGPDKEYMLDAVAKGLDTREGDTINKETINNAISVQVIVNFDNIKVLLCGDANFEAIKEKLSDYNMIQLPHHGKKEQGEEIFNFKKDDTNTKYFISDNTGTTNGGSDELDTNSYDVMNTKDGEIIINETIIRKSSPTSFLGIIL